MQLLDLSLAHPGENLALDEALLLECESNGSPGVLRFWESPVPFVVMGLANRSAVEVNLEACVREKVPVLRRTSGGGAVVQGPGCLNYALVLPFSQHPMLEGIHSTNDYVLSKTSEALSGVCGCKIEVQGTSDLAVDGRKFSGNAQRRKRGWVLYHGTLLLDFDIPMITRFLRIPSRQPDYRNNRSHADFVKNLPIPREAVKAAIVKTWKADAAVASPPLDRMRDLLKQQFAEDAWNFKF